VRKDTVMTQNSLMRGCTNNVLIEVYLRKLNLNNINPESSTNRAPEKREALFAVHVVPENACGA
jgi:hypothetical protein